MCTLKGLARRKWLVLGIWQLINLSVSVISNKTKNNASRKLKEVYYEMQDKPKSSKMWVNTPAEWNRKDNISTLLRNHYQANDDLKNQNIIISISNVLLSDSYRVFRISLYLFNLYYVDSWLSFLIILDTVSVSNLGWIFLLDSSAVGFYQANDRYFIHNSKCSWRHFKWEPFSHVNQRLLWATFWMNMH